MSTKEEIRAAVLLFNFMPEPTEADLVAINKVIYPDGKPEKMSQGEWEARHKPYNPLRMARVDVQDPPKHTCLMIQDAMFEWSLSIGYNNLGVMEKAYDASTGEHRERLDRGMTKSNENAKLYPNPEMLPITKEAA